MAGYPGGSALVAGDVNGRVSFGATTVDAETTRAYVARLAADGSWDWATSAGGSDPDSTATAVAVLPSGAAVVAGTFREPTSFGTTTLTPLSSSDAFVAGVDGDGDWTWATQASGSDSIDVIDVAGLPDGSALVTGRFEGTAAFGATVLEAVGFEDIYVARVDPGGSWVWARRAGGPSHDEVWDISSSPAGGAVLTGAFGWSADFGSTALASDGRYAAFVARVDPSGRWDWATATQGAGWSDVYGAAVDVTADGTSVVAGGYAGPARFGSTVLGGDGVFVARVTATGAWGRVRTAPTGYKGTAWPSALAVTSTGDTVVSGSFEGSMMWGTTLLQTHRREGARDAFVALLDGTGTWRWAGQVQTVAGGNWADSWAAGVVPVPDGYWLVAGTLDTAAEFGTTTVVSGDSGACVFAARVRPDGTWSVPSTGPGTIRVLSPADGSPISAGGEFGVTAVTTGYPTGAAAILELDGTPIASDDGSDTARMAAVDPDGFVRFEDVDAEPGGYAVRVGSGPTSLVSASVHLSVKPFGIIGHRTVTPPGSAHPREQFTIATGNFSRGTVIHLDRGFDEVGRVRVQAPGAPVTLVVPRVAGSYGVWVETAQGPLRGTPFSVDVR